MGQSRLVTVLGIDPGTTRMGFAAISGPRGAPRLLSSGVIGRASLSESGDRLFCIHNELSKIISELQPDYVAIEKLYFSKNVKTALAVAEARGIILLTAKMANRTVYEYAPQEIKLAVASRGNADKREVADMIKKILHITKLPHWDDETDAIAIAITGLVSQR